MTAEKYRKLKFVGLPCDDFIVASYKVVNYCNCVLGEVFKPENGPWCFKPSKDLPSVMVEDLERIAQHCALEHFPQSN